MIYVICSAGYMEERVRLNKLKEVFFNKKYDFMYIGWLRGESYKKKNINYALKHLWIGGGYANKTLLLHYPLWIFKVFVEALKLNRQDIVYAVGFDVALPIYLAYKIRGFKYIFDNPDNFSLIYNLKGLKKKLVNFLEKKIAKNALYHIIPSKARFLPIFRNEIYIPNFPLESEYNKAVNIINKQIKPSYNIRKIQQDKRFKIYINGRITKERGSIWIAKTIQKLDNNKFLFIIAGDINCNILNKVIQQINNVVICKRLPNYEALSIYFLVDLVLAFYDPKIPINVKAEPNKWWDCVKCNTPFISNSEIETLDEFKKQKACFTIRYKGNLVDYLNDLVANKYKLIEVKQNMKKLSSNDWEMMISEIFKI